MSGSLGHLRLFAQAHRPHPGLPRDGQVAEHAPHIGGDVPIRAVRQARGRGAPVGQVRCGRDQHGYPDGERQGGAGRPGPDTCTLERPRHAARRHR